MNLAHRQPDTNGPSRFHSLLERLHPAQRLVAVHVVQGLSNKEIADTLGKSELTIKTQVSQILKAYEQSSRSRLIVFFYENM